MVMYHHGKEAYDVAAAAAGAKAREKMGQIINAGIASAEAVYNDVLRSASIVDGIGQHTDLKFDATDAHTCVINGQPLTEHAFGQLCTRFGIKDGSMMLGHRSSEVRAMLPTMLETLARAEAREAQRVHAEARRTHTRVAAAHTTAREPASLLRVQDGIVRAVLSPSYKRRDSRPMLQGFMSAAERHGMVPVFGSNTELKYHLRAVLPRVFEPVPNEPLLFGLEWSNSDWGGGAHSIKFFVMRMWCTNMAMGDQVLREVHLGKQLDSIESWSDRTLKLEAQTATSAMDDLLKAAMSPERIGEYCHVVQKANEEKIDTRDALKRLVKAKDLTKGEADKIEAIATTARGELAILPSVADTTWALSNAVSWFAKGDDIKPTRRIELESVAGEILHV